MSTVLSCDAGTCPHGALSAQTWAERCCSSMVYSSRALLSGRWVSMWGVLLRLSSVQSSQPAPGISRLSRLITTDRSTVSPTRVFFRDKRSEFKLVWKKKKESDFFSPHLATTQFFPPLARLNFGAARPNEIQLKRTRRHFVISPNSQICAAFRPLYFSPRV